MTRPQSHPLAVDPTVSPALGSAASPIGAVAMPTLHGPTGEAGAPNLSTPSKMTCLECGGEGTGEYMALDERDYHVRRCHICDGSGLVAPYCLVCEGTLVAGFCRDCDFPSGWDLAERSALGMVKP